MLERIELSARVECGASIHASFQLTVRRIRMFFSLKPSLSRGKSSLKISAHWDQPFRWTEQTNTHKLSIALEYRHMKILSILYSNRMSLVCVCLFDCSLTTSNKLKFWGADSFWLKKKDSANHSPEFLPLLKSSNRYLQMY